jgi:hypothetical protein
VEKKWKGEGVVQATATQRKEGGRGPAHVRDRGGRGPWPVGMGGGGSGTRYRAARGGNRGVSCVGHGVGGLMGLHGLTDLAWPDKNKFSNFDFISK